MTETDIGLQRGRTMDSADAGNGLMVLSSSQVRADPEVLVWYHAMSLLAESFSWTGRMRVDGVNTTSVVVVLVVQLKRCSDCYTMHNSPEQQQCQPARQQSRADSPWLASKLMQACSCPTAWTYAVRHSTSHKQQSQRGLTQLASLSDICWPPCRTYAPCSWHVTTQVRRRNSDEGHCCAGIHTVQLTETSWYMYIYGHLISTSDIYILYLHLTTSPMRCHIQSPAHRDQLTCASIARHRHTPPRAIIQSPPCPLQC